MTPNYWLQYFNALDSKLFVLLSLPSIILASCAPAPIPIRIGNVSLATNEIARGLNISVGSPQQAFAFLPQWPLNNTFVYGTSGFCGTGVTATACSTFRGGVYDQLGSITRGIAAANMYPADASPYPTCNWVTDNLTLSSNVTLENFPIGIAQADWGEQSYFPQMALGLGPNSTVLSALMSTGLIASRSWSMFWGRTGATSATQLDGNFVFGGYDRAKVTGTNYTRSLSTAKTTCSTDMLVTITDMVLNFPNGTDASLFGSAVVSSVLAACIVPTYPVLLTIPTDPYFNNFEILTQESVTNRSLGVNFYGMLYSASGSGSIPYGGDLTIKLDSGLSVRIPNDQLVVPNLTIDSSSGAYVANSSTPELVLNAIQQVNANDLPQLGRQFLTAAYLMVNQDTSSFTLWAANPTSKTDFVAVDTTNNVVDTFCSAAKGASATAFAPASTSASASGSTTSTAATDGIYSRKMGTGIIAGIAVGSIAAIAAVVGVIIVLCMRSKRRGGGRCGLYLNSMRKQEDSLPKTTYVPQDVYKSELPGSGFEARHETDGAPIDYAQLHRHTEVQELPS